MWKTIDFAAPVRIVVNAMAARQAHADHTPLLSPTGVIAPAPIHIETPAFTGSLGLLLTCVRDHKVDLLGVPLYPICEAYFHYLMQGQQVNLDEAAAALTALAYLLERKAWLLLPVEAEPEDMHEPVELPEPCVHEYDAAIQALRMWEEERALTFFRPIEAGPDPFELPFTLNEVSPFDLARALERLLERARPDPPEILNQPRRSISDQMRIVLAALGPEWKAVDELIEGPIYRSEAVYWFLALLELIRLGQAKVRLDEGEVRFARAT